VEGADEGVGVMVGVGEGVTGLGLSEPVVEVEDEVVVTELEAAIGGDGIAADFLLSFLDGLLPIIYLYSIEWNRGIEERK